MSTIPADQIADIIPGVLAPGGNAINLNGVILTHSTRVPIGTLQQFNGSGAVASYFPAGATIAGDAAIYFNGFTGTTATPGALLVAQYNQTAVSAYLRGASIATLTLAQLQSLSGTLSVTVDGFVRSASINLASAGSFSIAASTIQTGLNASLPAAASFNGSVGPQTVAFTGSIAGNILNVSAVAGGTLTVGGTVGGSGVLTGTQLTGQLSGTTGGVGLYTVNLSQTVASESLTETWSLLTVTSVASGTVGYGQTFGGTVALSGTIIFQQISGAAGGTGTYAVNISQTIGSGAQTSTATAISVTYDSISGGILITSGVIGAASTIDFATGTISGSGALNLTQAQGAVTSQGAVPLLPGAFMNNLITLSTNWASFMTDFDPDGGSGNALKLQFAQWVSGQNDGYAYVCWDTDVTPTLSVPATSSLGYLINQVYNLSGICLIWHPDSTIAAFVMGIAASLNFNAVNGRTNFKFRSQPGLVAGVTNQQVANFLGGNPLTVGDRGNGYNFYGVFANATQQFIFFANGFMSGPFLWADSYYNQIWFNDNLQLSAIAFLTSIGSMAYNAAGNSQFENSLAGTIQQAEQFGVYRTGVTLSANQATAVNNAAGRNIVPTLFAQGYYLQVLIANPTVRLNRGTPPCSLWYTDGESVNFLQLASVDLL